MNNESKKITVRQDKYNTSYIKCLETGQKFERQIGNYFYSNGFAVRLFSDENPFIFPPNKKPVRLWDMEIINVKYKKLFTVEIKDIARCFSYEATGLPKDYVDDKISLSDKGRNLILLFRDNMDIVRAISKYRGISTDDILLEMQAKGLVLDTPKGIRFVPYGNTLHTIMMDSHRDKVAEKNVHSHFKGKGNPKDQYMWKLSSLMPLPILIKLILENPYYPYDKS